MKQEILISPLNVLLIEDNLADADLTIKALQDSRINTEINLVNDGEKALKYLLQEGE